MAASATSSRKIPAWQNIRAQFPRSQIGTSPTGRKQLSEPEASEVLLCSETRLRGRLGATRRGTTRAWGCVAAFVADDRGARLSCRARKRLIFQSPQVRSPKAVLLPENFSFVFSESVLMLRSSALDMRGVSRSSRGARADAVGVADCSMIGSCGRTLRHARRNRVVLASRC